MSRGLSPTSLPPQPLLQARFPGYPSRAYFEVDLLGHLF